MKTSAELIREAWEEFLRLNSWDYTPRLLFHFGFYKDEGSLKCAELPDWVAQKHPEWIPAKRLSRPQLRLIQERPDCSARDGV